MDGADASEAVTPTMDEVQKLLTELMVSVNRDHGADFSADGRGSDHKTEPELVANIQALQGILASCTRQTQEAIGRLNHRRNSFLPIHQLPLEILGRSIYLAIYFDLEPFSKRLSTLSTVCKRWHEVIQSLPRFWSVLDCRTRPSTLQHILSRSMNTPLLVNCDARHHPANVGWFLDTVLPHSARWESLYYCGSANSLGEVATVFESPTPTLSDFYVYNTDFEQAKQGVAQPLFHLSEGRNLRDVHLRAAVLSCDSPRMTDLRSLQLTWLSSPPSVADLSACLLQSPRLDSLVLAHFFPTSTAPAPSTPQPTFSIPMSELQDLEVLNVPQSYYFDLMARLEAPRCTQVLLGRPPKPEPSDTQITTNLLDSGILDPKYHAIRSTLHTTLISAEAIHIKVFKDHTIIAADFFPSPARQRLVTLRGRGRGRGRARGRGRGGFIPTTVLRDGWKAKPPPLLLTITPPQSKRAADSLPILAELLRSAGATAPVILTVQADENNTAEFSPNTFSGFATLKELNIDGLVAFRAAAKELGKPQSLTPEESQWACPELTEVHIRFGNEQKLTEDEAGLMVEWMRDRWSAPTGETKAPSPLNRFHFINHATDPNERWKSAWQQCKELVPKIAEDDESDWTGYVCGCKKFS
ncbi:hypothetical protein FRC01_006430 [Tulasnella sp. 417]|nr:hypothetical protein FRC01_006430 [Tulasnella sp. 417]